MIIFEIKLREVDHILKNPIEIDEDISYLGGKRMYVLSNKDFGVLSYHNSIEISRMVMKESINLIINSKLFEDYSDPEYKRALKFQNMIKRYVYG